MTREAKQGGIRWRLWLGLAALGAAGVSTAMAGYRVQRFVSTDPRFILSPERRNALTIEGLRHASRARLVKVFAGDFGRSVFSIPLAERRRRLLAIDWVQDASVSRVWPDRLIVRITERKPVAFVFFNSSVLLMDSQGVLLEPPPQAQFAFPVLSGVREEESESERRGRVRAMLRLLEDLGPMARDVSEVNAAEPDNLKLVAQVEGKVVELTMGDGNYAARYRNFLNHYPDIKKRLDVTAFDLRLDDRITARE